MHVEASDAPEPGMLSVHGEEMLVGCGSGTVITFDELQMDGKRRMTASEFLRGFQVGSGERLGL